MLAAAAATAACCSNVNSAACPPSRNKRRSGALCISLSASAVLRTSAGGTHTPGDATSAGAETRGDVAPRLRARGLGPSPAGPGTQTRAGRRSTTPCDSAARSFRLANLPWGAPDAGTRRAQRRAARRARSACAAAPDMRAAPATRNMARLSSHFWCNGLGVGRHAASEAGGCEHAPFGRSGAAGGARSRSYRAGDTWERWEPAAACVRRRAGARAALTSRGLPPGWEYAPA